MTGTTTSDPQLHTSVVEGLLRLLDKCLRAITLYSPTHPMYLQALKDLQGAFGPVWADLGSLTLQVQDNGFWWEEHLVFPEEHAVDSISWGLFKEGIRSVTLTPGVEEQEIVRLLDIIHEARSLATDAADDLLTLLWGQHFEHVRYHVIDLVADDAAVIEKPERSDPPPPAEDTQQQVEEEIAEVQRPEGLVNLDDSDATLYFLDDAEIESLKNEVNGEYTQNICINSLSMFLDILEVHVDPAVREETCGVLRDLFLHLLGVGDFSSVAYLLREVRVVLERATDLQPEHRATLEQFTAKLSQPDVIVQLLQSLDDADVHPTDEELGQLFEELESQALVTVLEWIPRLTNERAKGLLRRAAEQQAPRHPSVVKRALTSQDQEIILGGLRCVKNHKIQSVSDDLEQLLAHEDAAVRLALVAALGELDTPDALEQLEELLQDRDRDIRIAAVRALSVRGDESTLSLLELTVLGKPIRDAHVSEKRAFFDAYGALADESSADRLRPLIVGGLFRRRADPETRACVAMALAMINDSAATALLEKARRDRDPVVRNAVEKALRQIG